MILYVDCNIYNGKFRINININDDYIIYGGYQYG